MPRDYNSVCMFLCFTYSVCGVCLCDALTVCVCVYPMELAWAFAAACFPVLLSGVVEERRFFLMFGWYTWSSLQDVHFQLSGGCCSGMIWIMRFPWLPSVEGTGVIELLGFTIQQMQLAHSCMLTRSLACSVCILAPLKTVTFNIQVTLKKFQSSI